ncbi:zinc finger protein 567-like isoform X1 [Helicoverpa zea]|uniref:zinc finger protein 567-like isoform X1 n=1 Tax=Helicoverpa zea TaxID=7113 RepID=UPI001F5AF2AF|nr:zinc finger protein 567-like isoform X1 [Helicoverpa zea]
MSMMVCRVCLSTEEQNLLPLDETFINNYNLLTNLSITLLDGMPQNSCRTCLDTVKCYIEFREKSISAEETLRELVLNNVKSENKPSLEDRENSTTNGDNDDPPVKSEIKEEAYDSMDDFYSEYVENVNDIIVKKDEDEYDVPTKKRRKRLTATKPTKLRKTLAVKKQTKSIKKTKPDKKPTLKETLEIEMNNEKMCGICPKKFEDKNDLKKHIDVHKNTRACVICGERVNSLSQLLAHRVTHIPQGQNKCFICDKKFKSSIYLEFHYRNLHIEEDDKKLYCNQCPQVCPSPKKFTDHMKHVHSHILKYFCDTCSKGFRCKSNLKSHILSHNTNKSFVCDLCGFSCKQRNGLYDHKIRKHTPQRVYCKQCKRPFPNQLNYDNHKCRKVAAICPICGKEIRESNRLSRHMAVHSDVQKYECTRCPAKYKTKAALIAHMDRHDDNRTKQCEYCPAKFFTASVLIKHRRIHTGEKPYVCKICNKAFTGNHNLKVHMKVHGEYLVVKRDSVKQEDLINVAK